MNLKDNIQDFLNTDNLLPQNHEWGVECVLKEDGAWSFTIVSLSEKKKKVEIKKGAQDISAEELQKLIKKDSAVNLIVSGKGIINKKISFHAEEEDSVLVGKALPGAKPADFYIQKYIINESSAFVSLIRKQALDEILSFFRQHKILVVNIAIGPLAVSNILPLFELNQFIEQTISAGNYSFTILSSRIQSFIFSAEQKELNLSGLIIPSSLIFGFAAAMIFYLPAEVKITADSFADFKEEHKELKLHNRMMQWFMAAIVIICFSSFGLYKYYRSQFKVYYAKVQLNQEKISRFENLKSEIVQKKEILSQNGLLQSSRISYYSDRIAESLKEDVRLSRMDFSPIKKITKDGKDELVFLGEKLVISGNCSQSFDFNKWIKKLQKFEWVKEVSILNYMQDKSADLANFNIELQLNGNVR